MDIRSPSSRDHSIDNVRFLLIFCVVFAHFLEVCAPFKESLLIYKFIYSFHIPAFLFLFGYNAKFSPKRIVCRWCFSYAVFQCAYILFANYVLNVKTAFQFTTPHWLLWYLLACIYYQLLLPLFDTEDKGRQITTIIAAFILSLLIGFEKTVGYYMSLSRFFVFLPWFLLGYYCRKNNLLQHLSLKPKIRLLILFISAAIIAILVPFVNSIPKALLYGASPYASCKGTLWLRGVVSIMSFSVIVFLCVGIRPYLNRKLFLITSIGQNTWPIFLLHGFAIKAAPVYFPHLIATPWRVILLSCVIVMLAGNRLCSKAVYYACFSWLEKLSAKKSP